MDFSRIKLIIWDLDDTLWKGTLSEGNVILPEEHLLLLQNLVDTGVVCSICSKNDEKQVNNKLNELGIAQFFVFNSINWSPKGERVRQIINEMNLRQPNVLFIDDNASNRGEVKHSCPDILGAEDVDIIDCLFEYFNNAEKKDINHSRLKQYQVLQNKRDFKAGFGSNEEFLTVSNIRVEIKYDCENHIERIADLILRSNQLNFTKKRIQDEELKCLLNDNSINCGYVSVKDRFGDYGIVGFFAEKDNRLIHFVFSCRTLGMGVEQYVYRFLNCPNINIIDPVSSDLLTPIPYWITKKSDNSEQEEQTTLLQKVVIKGPCDMSQMFAYIKQNENIVTEFVYVNDKGVSIEQGTTTTHIVDSIVLDKNTQDLLINSVPFGDKHMFDTSIFDKDVACVVLSTFADPNLGIYQNLTNNAKIAFGEFCNDLTDETIWEDLISGKIFGANCTFTRELLQKFKKEYKYLGRITVDEILENIMFIFQHMSANAHLILVLGSETPFLNNTQKAYDNRHLYNQELNNSLRKWAMGEKRVSFLDFNKYITDQSVFTNNINHFTRNVYYQLSKDFIAILAEIDQLNVEGMNKTDVVVKDFLKRLKRKAQLIFKKSCQ